MSIEVTNHHNPSLYNPYMSIEVRIMEVFYFKIRYTGLYFSSNKEILDGKNRNIIVVSQRVEIRTLYIFD